MQLIIMRHGLAVPPDGRGPDRDRPLTPEGIERLTRQGIAMVRAGLKPDRLFSSPYRRAIETAEVLAQAFAMPLEVAQVLAPGVRLEGYAGLLEDLGEERVITVHHQPDVSAIIQGLCGAQVPMQEGNAALIQVRRFAERGGVLQGLYEAEVMSRLGEIR